MPQPPAPDTNAPRKHTVLVVDDAPENIDQLCALLEPLYNVKVATSGERALQIALSDAPPDLILLDVVMPGLSGFEVCRHIKAHPLRQHIPILFVTSLEQWDDEAHGLSLGAADYIVKPFREPIVLARVRTHLALFDQTQVLERKVQERTAELRANQERLRLAASVFTHAKEGIFIVDQRGHTLEINDAFTRITGYTREDVLGQDLRALVHSGRQSEEFYERRRRILDETGEWSGEIWNRRKNGEVHPEQLTLNELLDEHGERQAVVGLFTDLTETKAHASQLEHIAHYDTLTGLPNRVLLADRLQQALGHSQRLQVPLAVAALDLDGFKAVNDAHGHDAGDALLTTLAQRMGEVLRNGDTLARTGGDEFVAVLLGSNDARHDFAPVLGALLQAAAAETEVKGHALKVSASMGVTLYPQDNADVDGLLRHADQAMYLAKQAGKNRYHLFDIAHDAAVTTQRQSLEQIRRGLVAQEFVLHYQPKVNMVTGQVLGAEALIRWQHPERGLLPPGLFLPVIEDHPLSVDLGEWVIATALRQMAQWKQQGMDWAVSVNIGARQLQQENFATRLAALLAEHPCINPNQLELEILETSALEDVAWVSQVIHTCQALGVRFALDDFGTGYSSLTYLKRLPAETLKIDQSFVRDMLADRDDLSIVQTVIGLAAAFHRKVIAEGVETVAHGAALIPLGCELAQGYGIARPMPAQDFPTWAAHWQPDPSWAVRGTVGDDAGMTALGLA
jgi:diguanylate cyclase (GGDEF)-like protein/PAS domain S-box-containing protein